ncbi:MAG TPA: alpha/beta hydrolase [Longimicrobium sp.]|nr:alpha/beta hydrolase [Longimicrobium sp.]
MLTLTRFELRPADGGPPVRGDVRVREGTRPRTAVVIAHGFKGFRTANFFPNVARALAAAGHAAVSFDFSHNGVGADGVDFSALELFARNTHTREIDEIRQVVDALSTGALMGRAPRSIGLLGHSRGGGEAVIATAEDPRIDALVTWNAIAEIGGRWTEEQIARWRAGGTVEVENARTRQMMPLGPEYWADVEAHRERLDILDAAGRVAVPWLIVHGEQDETVSVDEGRRLFDAAGSTTELLVVEGGTHTFGSKHPYPGATPELQTAADATRDWFAEHLRA